MLPASLFNHMDVIHSQNLVHHLQKQEESSKSLMAPGPMNSMARLQHYLVNPVLANLFHNNLDENKDLFCTNFSEVVVSGGGGETKRESITLTGLLTPLLGKEAIYAYREGSILCIGMLCEISPFPQESQSLEHAVQLYRTRTGKEADLQERNVQGGYTEYKVIFYGMQANENLQSAVPIMASMARMGFWIECAVAEIRHSYPECVVLIKKNIPQRGQVQLELSAATTQMNVRFYYDEWTPMVEVSTQSRADTETEDFCFDKSMPRLLEMISARL